MATDFYTVDLDEVGMNDGSFEDAGFDELTNDAGVSQLAASVHAQAAALGSGATAAATATVAPPPPVEPTVSASAFEEQDKRAQAESQERADRAEQQARRAAEQAKAAEDELAAARRRADELAAAREKARVAAASVSASSAGASSSETVSAQSPTQRQSAAERRRHQFVKFYETHDPSRANLEAVDALLSNYKLEDIVDSLKTKYGCCPPGWDGPNPGGDAAADADTAAASPKPAGRLKGESFDDWYARRFEGSSPAAVRAPRRVPASPSPAPSPLAGNKDEPADGAPQTPVLRTMDTKTALVEELTLRCQRIVELEIELDSHEQLRGDVDELRNALVECRRERDSAKLELEQSRQRQKAHEDNLAGLAGVLAELQARQSVLESPVNDVGALARRLSAESAASAGAQPNRAAGGGGGGTGHNAEDDTLAIEYDVVLEVGPGATGFGPGLCFLCDSRGRTTADLRCAVLPAPAPTRLGQGAGGGSSGIGVAAGSSGTGLVGGSEGTLAQLEAAALVDENAAAIARIQDGDVLVAVNGFELEHGIGNVDTNGSTIASGTTSKSAMLAAREAARVLSNLPPSAPATLRLLRRMPLPPAMDDAATGAHGAAPTAAAKSAPAAPAAATPRGGVLTVATQEAQEQVHKLQEQLRVERKCKDLATQKLASAQVEVASGLSEIDRLRAELSRSQRVEKELREKVREITNALGSASIQF